MNNNLLWRMLKGQVINNQYHLKDLIGAGGYGGVFRADEVIRDKLIRQVAIKLIISDHHNDGQLNEIIAATDLQHPNLIRCFYGGESQLKGADFLYLVMEVADFSLEKRLTQGVLSETEATLLVQDIAEALVYLHNQTKAVTHRDLKPGNVLRVGDKWRLSDFGLVKIIGAGSVSNTSKVFGTAQYVPPESYDGEISPAWDVWALGIIIVEVLTGKPPFQGETEQQLQKQICEKDPDLSGLPQKFERIARGCLEKDRKKRWNAKRVLEQILLSNSVYVFLDSAGTENEGIYTLKNGDRNTVLMFEDKDDALRFSGILESQNFPRLRGKFVNQEEIKRFCKEVDLDYELIPSGTLATPPKGDAETKNAEVVESSHLPWWWELSLMVNLGKVLVAGVTEILVDKAVEDARKKIAGFLSGGDSRLEYKVVQGIFNLAQKEECEILESGDDLIELRKDDDLIIYH